MKPLYKGLETILNSNDFKEEYIEELKEMLKDETKKEKLKKDLYESIKSLADDSKKQPDITTNIEEEEIPGNVMQQLLENFDSIFDTLLEEDLINDNVDYIKNNETFRKELTKILLENKYKGGKICYDEEEEEQIGGDFGISIVVAILLAVVLLASAAAASYYCYRKHEEESNFYEKQRTGNSSHSCFNIMMKTEI